MSIKTCWFWFWRERFCFSAAVRSSSYPSCYPAIWNHLAQETMWPVAPACIAHLQTNKRLSRNDVLKSELLNPRIRIRLSVNIKDQILVLNVPDGSCLLLVKKKHILKMLILTVSALLGAYVLCLCVAPKHVETSQVVTMLLWTLKSSHPEGDECVPHHRP